MEVILSSNYLSLIFIEKNSDTHFHSFDTHKHRWIDFNISVYNYTFYQCTLQLKPFVNTLV